MKIKLIDYGLDHMPTRAHYNDAGADVYSPVDYELMPNETAKISLKFGLEIPDGFCGLIFPRSGLSSKGIVTQLPPIDSGYRGEVHAVISNLTEQPYFIHRGDRIGQLVILPIIITELTNEDFEARGNAGFGSSGK